MSSNRLRRLVGLAVTVILILAMFAACGPAAPAPGQADPTPAPVGDGNEVKVGFIWPLTGGAASIGQQHDDGARMAIERINAAGGIQSLGGAMMVPVVADTETSPDVGSAQVERLITVEDVVMVVGGYNSGVIFPASAVAQRHGIPFLSMGGVRDAITERGYEWIFRINNTATFDIREMIHGLELIEEQFGLSVETYALVWESTDWGADQARIWNEFAAERGWVNVLDESVPAGQVDMSSLMMRLLAADPCVINVSLYTPEQIVFTRATYAHQVNPRLGIWSVGGGTQDPAFFDAVQPWEYEYLFVQEDWNVTMPFAFDWSAELAAEVQERFGYPLNSFFAQGWTAAKVAAEVLERAGATDPESIRLALVDFEVELGSPINLTGYPRIVFGPDGQNPYSTGTIIQYVDGRQVALYPRRFQVPGHYVVVPIPDNFGERGRNSAPWGTVAGQDD